MKNNTKFSKRAISMLVSLSMLLMMIPSTSLAEKSEGNLGSKSSSLSMDFKENSKDDKNFEIDIEKPEGDTEKPEGDVEKPEGDTENSEGDKNPEGDTENPEGEIEKPKEDDNLDGELSEEDVLASVVNLSGVDNSMETVYVGGWGAMGNGTESNPASWLMAVQYVADGGTIYVMAGPIKIKDQKQASHWEEKLEGKSITIKAYSGNVGTKLEDSLIMYQFDGDCTMSNITFDGTGRAQGYNYDMVYVDYGNLTLDNCVIQNANSTDYGAALGIYSGTTVNLIGTKIIDNVTGKYMNSHAGGITISGTLNVDKDSVIRDNKLYFYANQWLDILVYGGGVVNLEGGAEVGNIAYAGTPDDDKINITSALENNINFYNFLGTGVNMQGKGLPLGSLIAKGAKGYTLTDEDIKKMTITNNNDRHYVLKDSDDNAFISTDFEIFLYPTPVNGSFNYSSQPSSPLSDAYPNELPFGSIVTIEASPKEGYSYKDDTIIVRAENDNDISESVNLTQIEGKNEWTFVMPKEQVNVTCEFEIIKSEQSVSDPEHLDGNSFTYVLIAGEDENMPLTMVNSTDFGIETVAPDPLISFSLDDVDTGIIEIEENKIIPLKIGSTVINAMLKETSTHKELTQAIAVKVVRPLAVKLNGQDYDQSLGIKVIASYIDGSDNPCKIDNTTRALGLRKVGVENLTPILKKNWNWDEAYTQAFDDLDPNTEYELVLTVNDKRVPAKTSEAVLRFKTPEHASTDTGKIEGTVTGDGEITVRVERGNTIIANKTGLGSNDTFSFANLPDGFYNLVGTNGIYTVTVMVEVKNGETTTLNVVIGSEQSRVSVEQGAPSVAADKLGDLFKSPIYTGNNEATNAVNNGGTVEIRLTARNTNSQGSDKTPVEAILIQSDTDDKEIAMLVNLTVDMIITPDGGFGKLTSISDTGELVTIALPMPKETQGKSGYQVMRYHDGKVDKLTEIEPGATPVAESYYVEGRYAHIYASKFSTYAIAHNKPINEFAINYELYGGINYSGAPTVYTVDTETIMFGTPTKIGYNFDGWYKEAEFINKITEIAKGTTGDVTIYAKWNVISGGNSGENDERDYYTLTYNTNGGSEISSSSHRYGEIVKLDKISARKDYTFEGWYEDIKLEKIVDEIKMDKNKTVYAKWNEVKVEDSLSVLNAGDHYAYIVGRGDGFVYPNADITRAEVATIFFQLLTDKARSFNQSTENDFVDVNSEDWFNTSVSTLAKMNIIQGKGSGVFDPHKSITRAEFAAIASYFANESYEGIDLFTDISDSWAKDKINKAANCGWVKGFGNGTFAPDNTISRAEAITIINNVLGRIPKSKEDLLGDMKIWKDNMDENAWYYLPIQEATNSHDYEIKSDEIHEKWTKMIK